MGESKLCQQQSQRQANNFRAWARSFTLSGLCSLHIHSHIQLHTHSHTLSVCSTYCSFYLRYLPELPLIDGPQKLCRHSLARCSPLPFSFSLLHLPFPFLHFPISPMSKCRFYRWLRSLSIDKADFSAPSRINIYLLLCK